MARIAKLSALLCAALLVCLQPAHAAFDRSQLEALSASFWQWRATEQPFTNDDIPLASQRASDFAVDWSPAAVKRYHARIADFEKQWRAIDITGASIPDQIDYRLLGLRNRPRLLGARRHPRLAPQSQLLRRPKPRQRLRRPSPTASHSGRPSAADHRPPLPAHPRNTRRSPRKSR